MKRLKIVFALFFSSFISIHAPKLQAAIISTDTAVTANFDLGYDVDGIEILWSGTADPVNIGEIFQGSVFDGLDATGSIVGQRSATAVADSTTSGIYVHGPLTGGVGSLLLQMLSGTSEVNTLRVRGLTCPDGTLGSCSVSGSVQLISSFSVSPVPIPAALPLFASAMAILGFFRWRRKRRVMQTLKAVPAWGH